MDGWETGRKRTEGHDWCIIQLGLQGTIKEIHVDTAFFTGNNAPKISIQATRMPAGTFPSCTFFCLNIEPLYKS
jgi:allantoicase